MDEVRMSLQLSSISLSLLLVLAEIQRSRNL